jgi:sugar lactone lactonase YvrE
MIRWPGTFSLFFRMTRPLALALILSVGFVGCTPTPPTSNNVNGNDNTAEPPGKPVITTVAGSGVAGLSEDGLEAVESPLYLPQDMEFGPDGLLYVVDWNNHRIRRVNADSTFETLVGTGELGDANDGYAREIQLNHPTNIRFDREGRMLVAAWHNSKVKRLNLETGLIENIAGTGARSYSGDGGPANMAALDLPSSVAVNAAGDIIISDQANYRLRLVDATGTIFTICGDGTPGYGGDGGPAEMAKLNSPRGQAAQPAGRIFIDRNDQIYIADTANHVIRMVDGSGVITTIAGVGTAGYGGDGGPALQAQFNTPSDVVVDANGFIYVADTMNNRVRRIAPDGTVTTVAGNGTLGYAGDGGPADEAQLNRPYGVALSPDGDLFIADTHNHRIRRITAVLPPDFDPNAGGGFPEVPIIPCSNEVGTICTYAGTGQTGYSGEGSDRLRTVMYWPFDMEFTPFGRTYVLDWNNHRVREILRDDTVQTIVGTEDVGDGPFDLSDLMAPGALGLSVNLNHPTDLFEFPNGDLGIIAWHNHKIRVYDPTTQRTLVIGGRQAAFEGDNGPFKDARVNQIARGVFDANGNYFFVDQRNQRIRVIRDFATQRGDGIVYAVVGTGVKGFNGDGQEPLMTDVSFPAGGNPEPTGGITIDASGVIYFADTHNHRIRRVEFFDADFRTGVVTTIAGTGVAGYAGDNGPASEALIHLPQDVELGPDGNLYFADTNNHAVRMINLETGVITTVAGNGTLGYSGDGGPAVNAQLNRPFGLAFDPIGDLYVSDTFNSRVRKVKLAVNDE